MHRQFARDKERADEARQVELLNEVFLPALEDSGTVICGTCRRHRNPNQRNHDADCSVVSADGRPASIPVEAKADHKRTDNLLVELYGALDLGLLPQTAAAVFRPGDSGHAELLRLADEGFSGQRPNGSTPGLLLEADQLPPLHTLAYWRKAKRSYWILRTRNLADFIRPRLDALTLALGPVQDSYRPYRSLGVLVPETALLNDCPDCVLETFPRNVA